ncbi:MAG: prolyl-tRNA synthetase associated domain-containing protein [Clostridia bacterium]|nr:prolyl-tRNA synthetase associated domain-containing protein [Clostridia bacterium]
MYIDPNVYTSKPENERLAKEMRCYDLLESLGVPYNRVDHDAANTMEDCAEAKAVLGVKICKNLLLCNQQKTKFYLLLMAGEKQFVTKDFSKKIGSSRLSFAPPEFMEKYLDITPGSLSVLGLMNDTECEVTLYIDRDVVSEEYFGCHPCINTSTISMKTSDLLDTVIPATKHEINFVELD